MLLNSTVPLLTGLHGRAQCFGSHRSMTLGMVQSRITRKFALSAMTKKFPELWSAIETFGKTLCPFSFTSVHVNHNVVCPKHTDPKNIGDSLLVSFGDYTGSDLVLENIGSYNTNLQPIIFNGSNIVHWNTELTGGNKYSLVFFSCF